MEALMDQTARKALLSQMHGYIKAYTDQHVTIEGAVLNYTRQFPHRVHTVIVALLEENELHEVHAAARRVELQTKPNTAT